MRSIRILEDVYFLSHGNRVKLPLMPRGNEEHIRKSIAKLTPEQLLMVKRTIYNFVSSKRYSIPYVKRLLSEQDSSFNWHWIATLIMYSDFYRDWKARWKRA